MANDRDSRLHAKLRTTEAGPENRHSDSTAYSEAEYDAALAQIITAESTAIKDDLARGRTYTLDEWLQDDH